MLFGALYVFFGEVIVQDFTFFHLHDVVACDLGFFNQVNEVFEFGGHILENFCSEHLPLRVVVWVFSDVFLDERLGYGVAQFEGSELLLNREHVLELVHADDFFGRDFAPIFDALELLDKLSFHQA